MQRYQELSLASHWPLGGLCQWTDSDCRIVEKLLNLELNEGQYNQNSSEQEYIDTFII